MEAIFKDRGVPALLDHAGVEAARLQRVARDELVSSAPSVTYPMLAEARDSNVNAVRQWVNRHRNEGRIVVVTRDDNTVLIPSFQFDQMYDLDDGAAPVIASLKEREMSDWAIWRWFYAENAWVQRRPIDLLHEERGVDRLLELVGHIDAEA